MGLDNSIEIKRNEYSNKIKALKQFEADWDKDKTWDFEVCYWRKCWNVRSDILNVLSAPYNGEGGTIDVAESELQDILRVLKSYNEKTWDDFQSIWTWEEQKPHMKRYIKNIKKLIKLKKKYPELEIYFVDSY